jgi:hypothetical protein
VQGHSTWLHWPVSLWQCHEVSSDVLFTSSLCNQFYRSQRRIRECIQKLYRYFVSQSSEFCRHNPLCCFSASVYCCCLFRYRFSPETFGYTLVRRVLFWTTRTEGSWVRIPLKAQMYVRVFLCCAVVCIGRGLAVGRCPIQGVLRKCLTGLRVSDANSESEQVRGPNPRNAQQPVIRLR